MPDVEKTFKFFNRNFTFSSFLVLFLYFIFYSAPFNIAIFSINEKEREGYSMIEISTIIPNLIKILSPENKFILLIFGAVIFMIALSLFNLLNVVKIKRKPSWLLYFSVLATSITIRVAAEVGFGFYLFSILANSTTLLHLFQISTAKNDELLFLEDKKIRDSVGLKCKINTFPEIESNQLEDYSEGRQSAGPLLIVFGVVIFVIFLILIGPFLPWIFYAFFRTGAA